MDQDIDFCREIADRFDVLDRGTAVAGGPIAGLTDEFVAQYMQI